MHNYLEMKRHLLKQAFQSQIPIVGEFELTSQCNFRCQMCYLLDEQNTPNATFDQWKAVFDDAISEGLMFALLTGGESLIHPDFIRIYNYLFDKGVKITLFSNGSFLSDEILSLLEMKKPELIAITLYGGDSRTYDAITRVHGGLTKVEDNILRLQQHHIPVLVRTIPLRPILLSLDKIIDKVKEWGLNLGYFLYVQDVPGLNLKLSPRELVEFERIIRSAFPRAQELPPKGFHDCGALQNSYYVSSQLIIKPCAMAVSPTAKWEKGKLKETLTSLRAQWNQVETISCKTCDSFSTCIACKARVQLEGKGSCSDYLKEISRFRKVALD